MAGREAERREHLVGLRPLHGEHGVGLVLVGDRDAVGRVRLQPSAHLGGVGGVGHEQDVVVVVQVGDQVVDHAAGGRVAGERVLRLPGPDPAEVVAQAPVQVRRSARPADVELAEVADVEDADGVAHGSVLLEHAGGVLQRHLPAAELGELRPQRSVPVVEGRLLQGHARQVTAATSGVRLGQMVLDMTHRDDVHPPQGQPREDPDRPGGDRRRQDVQGRPGRLPGSRGRRLGVRPQVQADAQLDGLQGRHRRGAAGADRWRDQVRPAARGRSRQARRPHRRAGTTRRRRGRPQRRQRRLRRARPPRPRRRARARRRRRVPARQLLLQALQVAVATTRASPTSRSSATPRGARTRSRRWTRRRPSRTSCTRPATG